MKQSFEPDPYDLDRFLQAQASSYEQAIAELRQGRKRSHWMWYIFPQFDGLGLSAMFRHYAIKSIDEAIAYLSHPILGTRLTECALAVLNINGLSAYKIFGSPDDMKLRSCVTLFAYVSPPNSIFEQILNQFFRGDRDQKTIDLLGVVYNVDE